MNRRSPLRGQAAPDGLEASFRERKTRVPSYEWRDHPHVVVGEVLPEEGVTLHPVPSEYGVTRYHYRIVDNQPALVDPTGRRIVEVVR